MAGPVPRKPSTSFSVRVGAFCGELVSVLDSFPERSSSRKDRDRVRVKSSYFLAPLKRTEEHAQERSSEFDSMVRGALTDLGKKDTCLLLAYDHGSFLRGALGQLTAKQLGVWNRLVERAQQIVIGLNSDLNELGWLTRTLKPAQAANRTVIQVTADGLRKAGLPITKYGALEETIDDIFASLDKHPMRSLLDIADDMVVVFSETGGLHLHNSKKGTTGEPPRFSRRPVGLSQAATVAA